MNNCVDTNGLAERIARIFPFWQLKYGKALVPENSVMGNTSIMAMIAIAGMTSSFLPVIVFIRSARNRIIAIL